MSDRCINHFVGRPWCIVFGFVRTVFENALPVRREQFTVTRKSTAGRTDRAIGYTYAAGPRAVTDKRDTAVFENRNGEFAEVFTRLRAVRNCYRRFTVRPRRIISYPCSRHGLAAGVWLCRPLSARRLRSKRECRSYTDVVDYYHYYSRNIFSSGGAPKFRDAARNRRILNGVNTSPAGREHARYCIRFCYSIDSLRAERKFLIIRSS